MKRNLLVVAVLLAATVGTAFADDHKRWYAGVAVGQASVELVLTQPSFPPMNTVIDESEDLTKILFGYKPIKYMGIEASILGGGEISTVVGESMPGVGDGFNVTADHFGGDISLLGILPLADNRVDIYGRVGLQHETFNVTITDQIDPLFSGSEKEKIEQTSRLLGLGVQVNLGANKNMGIRLEGNVVSSKNEVEKVSEALIGFVVGW